MSNITNRYGIFNRAIQKNYANQINQLMSEYNKMYKEDLEIECQNLGSTKESCSCLETKLISKMFSVKIPCKHQICLGSEISPQTTIKLPTFDSSVQETNVSWTFITEEGLNKSKEPILLH
jgi:hypothetical protein